MKILYAALAVLLSIGYGYGQNTAKITWGEYIEMPKGHKSVGFVGDKNIGYIQFGEDPFKAISATKISPDLKKQGSEVKTFEGLKKPVMETVVQLGDKAYVLVTAEDKEVQKDCLMAYSFDIKTGKFLGSAKKIIQATTELEGRIEIVPGVGYVMRDRFTFSTTDDGKGLLVFYQQRPTRKSPNDNKLCYQLFDANLQEVWNYEGDGQVILSASESGIQLDGKDVSNVYCYNDQSGYAQLGIGVYHADQKRGENIKLPMDKISIQDVSKLSLGNGKVIVAGYYSNTPGSKNSVGYFTVLVDVKQHTAEKVNKFPFKQEVINAFESERTKRKLEKEVEKGNGPGIPNMQIERIVKKTDGGFYIVGQQFYYVVVTSGNETKIYYKYQDAIVCSVDENGNEESVVKIPKQQKFVNSKYGSGIGAFEYKGNLYLFYLDNTANKNLSEGGVPVEFREFKEGSFVVAKVTPKGQVSKTFLFEMSDENKTILPDGINQIEPGLLISAGRRSQIIGGGKSNTPGLIKLE